MKALFAKRLFVRVMSCIWIVTILSMTATALFLAVLFGMDWWSRQPGMAQEMTDPQTQKMLGDLRLVMSVIRPALLPLAVLMLATVLGAIVTMTMSQDVFDTYNSRTFSQASGRIATEMGYDPTMQRTGARLNETYGSHGVHTSHTDQTSYVNAASSGGAAPGGTSPQHGNGGQ